MVYLTMTPAIVAALETIRLLRLDLGDGDNDTKYSLDQPAVGDPIGHAQIIAISKLLRNQDSSVVKSSMSYHLDQLLRGSRICSEPPKPKAEPVIHSSIFYAIPMLIVKFRPPHT